jgi:replicative DNA helicase
MSDKLSSNYLNELAKLCLSSQDVTEIVKQHLNYSFIKGEEYKEVFKYIFDYHGIHSKIPTLGTLSQNLPQKPSLINVLNNIRETSIHDSKDQIMQSFESFIKKGRFQKLHEDVKEMYNKQEHEKAMLLLEKESKEINSFDLSTKLHSRVFADFDKRQLERKQKDFTSTKWPIGIPAFDFHTRGGIEQKTSLLGMARSGVGKSTLLRSIGFNIAFRGGNVVHFQAEGSKDEVQDAYDSMWTGVPTIDIKKGDLTGKDLDVIEKARRSFLAQCGEIFIIVYDQFETASIAQARQQLIDLQKTVKINAALFDYLDLFDPGDGKRYSTNGEGERARKISVARKIVNLATELDMFTATMTQASDIEKKDWNDPNFVITRNNISNLKATVDPFAYFITLNQTEDENDKDIIRIHEDKLRHYRIKSWENTYHVSQNREVGRFIDIQETNKRFWDPINNKIIKNAPKQK